jgi:spermidine synthase
MKVHVDDGRLFVKRIKKKYDWIILDAYQNDYIPFHLTTLEFLKEVKSRLKDDGVVVSNITSQFRNKFFDSMVMTYKKAFPHLYVFKGKKSSNFIFVATASSKIKDRKCRGQGPQFSLPEDLISTLRKLPQDMNSLRNMSGEAPRSLLMTLHR